MCTVTYIAHEKGFWLTSNRDEAPSRSPKTISRKMLKNGETLLFPRDTKAGGTWIAASTDNRVVCLLNGAFEKHEHRPPYRLSRGLMALDFFEFPMAELFFAGFDFDDIEPFTMVAFDNGDLFEFRWDGLKKHLKSLDSEGKHIWSSATLYTPDIRLLREQVFQSWLTETPVFSRENILQLHKTGGIGDPQQDFVMNRDNRVRTVSITSIAKNHDEVEMQYFDLLHDEKTVERKFPLQEMIALTV